MKLSRAEKKYIEFELRHYPEKKKEWNETVQAIILGSDYTVTDMPRGSDISNPAQKKALQLASSPRLAHLERITRAIERIVGELPPERHRLVMLRYWKEPRILTDEGIAAELSIDRATLYRWADKIILGIAMEIGVIDISCDKHATFGRY